MKPAEIFSLVSRRGIILSVENKKLRFQAPKDALTPALRNLLSENRDEIIAYLENNREPPIGQEAIAVIGMDCRFPGANNTPQFWENLRNGIESIRRFTDAELDAMGISPEIYHAPNYVKAAPVIDTIDMFDNEFFGYSPRDAAIIDPQQRLFLECAWTALENAGYDPAYHKNKIGVFGGAGPNYYNRIYAAQTNNFNVSEVYRVELGNENDYLATRVAYKLGLKGPALTIQTACSTSLVAVHVACQNLLTRQCDIALAGGVSINVRMKGGYFYEQGMIPSPDGHCRAFDAKGQGTVGGQGVGIVVLKRMSDAFADGDRLYAIIRGSAINNDGAAKVGFTAPSIIGQSEVIIEAHSVAGVTPEDISYVETHGTGTPLGDPIEIKALTKAFRMSTNKCNYCAIGSVKTNIGHLDAAAGIAGLIKTVLMLDHKEIPPILHFQDPNPNIDFKNSPFFVNTQLKKWDNNGSPRRAGVSSFGLGGTNAHMVLEEASTIINDRPSHRIQHPLVFSAKTENALNTAILKMASHLEQNPGSNLADIAYTLQVGRKSFAHRGTVICTDLNDAIAALRSTTPGRVSSQFCEIGYKDVVFMFSGQGSQYVNMGLGLYRDEPVFREQIDYCSEILREVMRIDLRQLLFPEDDKIEEAEERLMQTSITQPALFATEYALAKLWMSWGIQPGALVGHSIGEYTAACLSGVFTPEEALKLVAARGRLMQDMPRGSMLTVFLPENQTAPFINADVSVSVINSPSICVFSGKDDKIDDLEKTLSQKQIMYRRLHTSHAFHSKMMDPVVAPFTERVKSIRLELPKIPFLSNLTGTWITPGEATDPGYWARQLRGTVRFADCLQELFKDPNRIMVEVGPGTALNVFANQHPAKQKSHIVFSSTRHPKAPQSDSGFILDTLCGLWRAGVSIDWMAFHAGANRQRVPLPTYPFERKRFWIESQNKLATAPFSHDKNQHKECLSLFDGDNMEREARIEKEKSIVKNIVVNEKQLPYSEAEKAIKEIWRKSLGHSEITIDDNFFTLGGHSLLAISIINDIEKSFGIRFPLSSLIEAPTIREFLPLLEKWKYRAASPFLVPLSTKGSKPPFFLMHSHGGNILEYQPLANHLKDDRPVYAIQCRGLDGSPVKDMDVEAMAVTYLKELRSVQPKGPYYIGGFCFGGYLSVEIAHLLNAENEEVKLLVLMNSSTYHYNVYKPGISRLQRLHNKLKDRIAFEWDELSKKSLKAKFQRIIMRADRMYDLARNKFEIMLDKQPAWLPLRINNHSLVFHLELIAEVNDHAWMRYRPRPYNGTILFLRAQKQPSGILPDPMLGWKGFLTGEVNVHEVPGFRQNMLDEPNVTTLAKFIREHLP